MSRTACSLLLVAGLAGPWAACPGPARAEAPSRDRVRMLLSAYEHGPRPSAWRALGPATVGVLAELYDDAGEPFYVRIRAVEAAGHFRTPASRTFLRAVARAAPQRDLMVRAAVLALGRAFGASALRDVTPFLGDRRVAVREGAIVALVRMQDPAARAALRAHLRVEDRPHLRARIARALADAPDTVPGDDGDTRPR